MNVAVTFLTALIVTTHAPLPVQSPDQLMNVPPDGVSVTIVRSLKSAAHVPELQLMPAGDDVTVPVPAIVTLSVRVGTKFAATVVDALSVTVQSAVPEQPPPVQPVNAEPASAAAWSTTIESVSKSAAHVPPQLMPAGVDVTVPEPVPVFVIVSVLRSTNVAVIVTGPFIVGVHVPVPEQPPPLQPAKRDPLEAVAVSVGVEP